MAHGHGLTSQCPQMASSLGADWDQAGTSLQPQPSTLRHCPQAWHEGVQPKDPSPLQAVVNPRQGIPRVVWMGSGWGDQFPPLAMVNPTGAWARKDLVWGWAPSPREDDESPWSRQDWIQRAAPPTHPGSLLCPQLIFLLPDSMMGSGPIQRADPPQNWPNFSRGAEGALPGVSAASSPPFLLPHHPSPPGCF